ncbi:MAG: hypothetical protein KatS3mg082_1417 [Nitrospiraceae bacterium]|nr:MAG: hypothetical protein KatS3mg082_1417 [Nitrospiraceae bacterium]
MRNRKNERYGKIEPYSQDRRDLGTMSIENYTRAIGDIFGNLILLRKPKGHCVIDVGSLWSTDQRVEIHVPLIEELRQRGYDLGESIIWDQTHIANKVGILRLAEQR